MFSILQNERGQSLAEYALLILLIALVVAVVLLVIGVEVGNAFNSVGDVMN